MIDFIIVGAQKGGTTAAAYNLNKHPDISVFAGITEYGQYEIEFFNQHWNRGANWYFEQLPKSEGIVGEKTAELFHRTICHERIFAVNPKAKLLVLLRCPIERAFSQWRMATYIKKDESKSFDEVVLNEYANLEFTNYKREFYSCNEVEISCWREGYIMKGFYYEQLQNLLKYFPKENIHIAISEEVSKNKETEYNKMFYFLNVMPFVTDFENRFVGKPAQQTMNKKTYNFLREIYSKSNESLFNYLGYQIVEWSNNPLFLNAK